MMMKDTSTGQYVEALVLELLEEMYDDRFQPSTDKQDMFEGTDCFIRDQRVDITINEHKSYTKQIKSITLPGGLTLWVGIRRRNYKQRFKDPVLVLLFETFGLTDRFEISELIMENFTEDAMDTAVQIFNDFLESKKQ